MLGEIFCERHLVIKTAALRKKCRERGAFWRAWEDGRGPGHNVSPSKREPMAGKPCGGCGGGTQISVRIKREPKQLIIPTKMKRRKR